MSVELIDTLIVGGGQAGIAMSEHLSAAGVPHLILERHRIAERWRTERWDSLVANGPAWHDRFPSLTFAKDGPDDFPSKENVADYFVDYARHIGAPIRCGVDVSKVTRNRGRPGFTAQTSQGVIEAARIVAATGPFQRPVIPPVVPEDAPIIQMHSTAYRNPGQLPSGAVLVVGAGSSGSQIADELLRSGRTTYLSVGPHDRPPRSYRGRDFVWWLGVLGKWDMATPAAGTEHVTIAVSGAHGGETVDFRRLAARGMHLLGVTQAYEDGVLSFADDLARNIERGDANYLSVLDEADAFVVANGLDLPPEPDARVIDAAPSCMTDPVLSLDLARAGVTCIIWATGFVQDYGWLQVDAFVVANGLDLPPEPDARVIDAAPSCMTDPVLSLDLARAGVTCIIWATGFVQDYGWLQVDAFDGQGRPDHQRGVSTEPGVYFLGLPWQSRRGSSFIWGVWHDARYLADQIAIQRGYLDHHTTHTAVIRPKGQEAQGS